MLKIFLRACDYFVDAQLLAKHFDDRNVDTWHKLCRLDRRALRRLGFSFRQVATITALCYELDRLKEHNENVGYVYDAYTEDEY